MIATHLVGEAERAPLSHAQDQAVGDHAALAHRQAQVPQPGSLPRRPHRFSYRRRPFPSVPEDRCRRVYETPRLPKPRILFSFIHSSAWKVNSAHFALTEFSEVVCALRLRKLMRKLGFGQKRWAASMPSLATRSFLTHGQASRPGDDTLSGGAHLNYESIW
jgi:hypothetical protein